MKQSLSYLSVWKHVQFISLLTTESVIREDTPNIRTHSIQHLPVTLRSSQSQTKVKVIMLLEKLFFFF